MAAADWTSKQAYPDAKTAEAEDLAWECLRRDVEYEKDYEVLASSERSGAMSDDFRRKWGLSFRRGSANAVR
ncbi:transcriptional regulator domain-containing protein [Bradyrhizobium sp. USDA 3315]